VPQNAAGTFGVVGLAFVGAPCPYECGGSMRKRTDNDAPEAIAVRILVELAGRPDALRVVTRLVKLLSAQPAGRSRDRR